MRVGNGESEGEIVIHFLILLWIFTAVCECWNAGFVLMNCPLEKKQCFPQLIRLLSGFVGRRGLVIEIVMMVN